MGKHRGGAVCSARIPKPSMRQSFGAERTAVDQRVVDESAVVSVIMRAYG
jgi:hypothetical protein